MNANTIRERIQRIRGRAAILAAVAILYLAASLASLSCANHTLFQRNSEAQKTFQMHLDGSLGDLVVQPRIASPLIIHGLMRITGASFWKTRLYLRLLSLWVLLLLLHGYLLRWGSNAFALSGCLFYAAMSPLLYLYHFYHPWDAFVPILAVLLCWSIRDDHILAISFLVALGALFKVFSVFFPFLYLLAYLGKKRMAYVVLPALGWFVLTVGVHEAVYRHYGMSFLPLLSRYSSVHWGQLSENLASLNFWQNGDLFRSFGTLAFYGPMLLSCAVVFAKVDRFLQASAVWAALLVAYIFCNANIWEPRAMTFVVPAILPQAMILLDGWKGPAKTGGAGHA